MDDEARLSVTNVDATREARLRARLVDFAADVITVADRRGRIIFQSRSAMESFGRAEGRYGEPILDNVHPDDLGAVRLAWQRVLAQAGNRATAEFRTAHGDGSWRMVEAHAVNRLDDPTVNGVVINMRDITERKAAEDRIQQLISHDDVTGVPNRHRYLALVTHAVDIGEPVVILVSLDNLGAINSAHGHAIGDAILQQAAERLGAAVPMLSVARFGGSSFGLVGTVDEHGAAASLAGRVRDAFKQPFGDADHRIAVTVSIGVATGCGESKPAPVLVADAENALRAAKQDGGDRIVNAGSPSAGSERADRMQLAAALRLGIDAGELDVHYQPIIDIEDGVVHGFEALARWSHPATGPVGPERFIGMAEESDLIIDLGVAVLRQACSDHAKQPWPAGGAPTVSVNVSPRQLQHPEFVAEVRQALADSGLPPARLVLEITESTIVANVSAASKVLSALRDMGVRIAVDDFGTGHSSLAQLKRLPVDVLKIDRSFVRGVGKHQNDTHIIHAIVQMARGLGISVIAEGVEHREQIDALTSVGCSQNQGFYWSAAVPIERLPQTVARLERSLREFVSVRHRALAARLDAAQSRFADFCHEVQAPLTALDWAISTLGDSRLDPTVSAAFAVVESAAGSFRSTLTHFAKEHGLEAGAEFPDRIPNLGALVADAIAEIRPAMEGMTLVLRTAAEPVPVTGDVDDVRRAVINLLTNAERFSPVGGLIEVEVSFDATHGAVVVRDRGPGVDAQESDLIFERHYRSSNVAAGHGLGLSIARETARRYGGDLTYCDTDGGGATFTVTLPLHNPAAGLHAPTDDLDEEQEHGVHLYRHDRELIAGAAAHLAAGHARGALLVLAVMPELQQAIESELVRQGVSLAPDHYLALSPSRLVDAIVADGTVARDRFWDALRPAIEASDGRYVYGYGQGADLLHRAGRSTEAADLERLWGQLAASYPASILCAVRDDAATVVREDVVAQHRFCIEFLSGRPSGRR